MGGGLTRSRDVWDVQSQQLQWYLGSADGAGLCPWGDGNRHLNPMVWLLERGKAVSVNPHHLGLLVLGVLRPRQAKLMGV